MTLRLTIGIDPGMSGAVAVLADGEPLSVFDMPRNDDEVDAGALAEELRLIFRDHPGAHVSACIESVNAAPINGRRQGTTSMFNFGQSYGKAKAVIEVLRIPCAFVVPSKWKRDFGIAGEDKDEARQLAIRRFPSAKQWLGRKKDHGRADALLLALWRFNDWQK